MLRGVKMVKYRYGWMPFSVAFMSVLLVLTSSAAEASCIVGASSFTNLKNFILVGLGICLAVGYGARTFYCLVKWQPAKFYMRRMFVYVFALVFYLVLMSQLQISEYKDYEPNYSFVFASLEDFRYYQLFIVADLDVFLIQSLFYFMIFGMIGWDIKYRKTALSLFASLWLFFTVPYAYHIYGIFQWKPKSCAALEEEYKRPSDGLHFMGCPQECIDVDDAAAKAQP